MKCIIKVGNNYISDLKKKEVCSDRKFAELFPRNEIAWTIKEVNDLFSQEASVITVCKYYTVNVKSKEEDKVLSRNEVVNIFDTIRDEQNRKEVSLILDSKYMTISGSIAGCRKLKKMLGASKEFGVYFEEIEV